MEQAYRLGYLSTKILLFLKEQFKEPQTLCFNELDFLKNCMKVNKKIRNIIVKSDTYLKTFHMESLPFLPYVTKKREKNEFCLNKPIYF